MLSFVLLQLEPLFRYDSREWSGESKSRSNHWAYGHVTSSPGPLQAQVDRSLLPDSLDAQTQLGGI
ncbi:BQ5605_C003g02253 [Microbotryum silenes-dioicae]|uniref:BQ5605_C003g02253 protein n=1 Tax=Microbotryum silenes-dioicae TaxID=796604 RepID=A0A2X0M561_9BASI|nr:BQ5605_C003g02253 [Microbotryum silenes-dioicae]